MYMSNRFIGKKYKADGFAKKDHGVWDPKLSGSIYTKAKYCQTFIKILQCTAAHLDRIVSKTLY
jgi:hypothetical protein